MKQSILLALAVAFASGNAAWANLLDDPGFEAATHDSQTSNSAWTLTDTDGDDTVQPAKFWDASWASNPLDQEGTGVWFRAFLGNDTAPVDATLSQTVAAGPGVYDLSFFVRHETNYLADSASVILSSDAGDSATFDLLGSANDGAYNQYSIANFVASAGTTALTVDVTMIGGRDAMANPQSLMVDDFALTSVPEPAALALAGLAVAGALARRRR
ncbi:MAG: PEP-CTERM sorting domain-containing protein [Planctomycetales bacterium]|nr:PEP-CTERM sorting domain-containing protein [Planctomycetales bacterium]